MLNRSEYISYWKTLKRPFLCVCACGLTSSNWIAHVHCHVIELIKDEIKRWCEIFIKRTGCYITSCVRCNSFATYDVEGCWGRRGKVWAITLSLHRFIILSIYLWSHPVSPFHSRSAQSNAINVLLLAMIMCEQFFDSERRRRHAPSFGTLLMDMHASVLE